MAKTTSQLAAPLAILTVLAVAALAVAGADAPPKRSGQEIHLFEVTVRVVDNMDDDYNYRLLAAVLGSVEAARSATFETEPGTFSAFLTNNQKSRGCWEFGKGMTLCLRRATDISSTKKNYTCSPAIPDASG